MLTVHSVCSEDLEMSWNAPEIGLPTQKVKEISINNSEMKYGRSQVQQW